MPRTVRRVCTLCEANCGLSFEFEGNRITSVRPDREDPFSGGYVCPKGMAIAELHDDPDRLRQPLRRTASGEFEPIGWDEALAELAAAGLARVRAAHGANAVGIPCIMAEGDDEALVREAVAGVKRAVVAAAKAA